eukprot:CAMPEP_0119152742 /NCGR_PEP_ID=MMETSP1310-20130426/48245_1 /TAXON_ID=464262 /ORGANISM="Genus nov. species nov., Strain RCC2339" /LENGTH=202 /DNA_ID=CAMNT_0007145141 /DNA_START=217 /DNA_END=825 /DNA_ORIENTATION=-
MKRFLRPVSSPRVAEKKNTGKEYESVYEQSDQTAVQKIRQRVQELICWTPASLGPPVAQLPAGRTNPLSSAPSYRLELRPGIAHPRRYTRVRQIHVAVCVTLAPVREDVHSSHEHRPRHHVHRECRSPTIAVLRRAVGAVAYSARRIHALEQTPRHGLQVSLPRPPESVGGAQGAVIEGFPKSGNHKIAPESTAELPHGTAD